MPSLTETLIVKHRPEDLFDLVKDIRRYPEFIRWIQTLTVSNERMEQGAYKCTGTASVGFRGFNERFSTDVIADAERREILVSLVKGPFKRLQNRWRFTEITLGQSRIEFFIDYEFRNPILAMLARANTKLAVDRIMGAFLAEADRRYKTKP